MLVEQTPKVMKNRIAICVVLALFSSVAFSQVKIGDNPETLDATSLLELESSTRALVITRVDTSTMNDMTPLRGALVYNTDAECVFYCPLCSGMSEIVNSLLIR